MYPYKVVGSNNHIHQYDFRNHSGRIFFTTDLHGNYELLHEKLREVGFHFLNGDILIVGGDWTDRGPHSHDVLDYLDEPWIISVQGNHEEIFIGAFNEGFNERKAYSGCLFDNGGEWARKLSHDHAKAIAETFAALPLAIELLLPTETVGIIHAEVPYCDWNKFKDMEETEYRWDGRNTAQWGREKYRYSNETHVAGVDRVFVGHTPTNKGSVEILGNVWYCDLGSHFRDKIGFVEIFNGVL